MRFFRRHHKLRTACAAALVAVFCLVLAEISLVHFFHDVFPENDEGMFVRLALQGKCPHVQAHRGGCPHVQTRQGGCARVQTHSGAELADCAHNLLLRAIEGSSFLAALHIGDDRLAVDGHPPARPSDPEYARVLPHRARAPPEFSHRRPVFSRG